MLLRDGVNKTSLLRRERRELACQRGKIDIFLPLRTCCFATKLLLMRPRPAPMNGLSGAECRVSSCPTAQFAKHNRVNRGFLTVNKQQSERDISAEHLKLLPAAKGGKNISNNTAISQAFVKLNLKCYTACRLFMECYI